MHHRTGPIIVTVIVINLTPWPELRANYTDRAAAACRRSQCQVLRIEVCSVVSATDPHSRILGLLDRIRYFFFQVAPQLYSRG
jgi:hypothetical protein